MISEKVVSALTMLGSLPSPVSIMYKNLISVELLLVKQLEKLIYAWRCKTIHWLQMEDVLVRASISEDLRAIDSKRIY